MQGNKIYKEYRMKYVKNKYAQNITELSHTSNMDELSDSTLEITVFMF